MALANSEVYLRLMHTGSHMSLQVSLDNYTICANKIQGTECKANGPTFVAGRLSIALANSASSLSNTGLPRPFGLRRTTHVTTPPQLSPRTRTSLITAKQNGQCQHENNILCCSQNAVECTVPIAAPAAAARSSTIQPCRLPLNTDVTSNVCKDAQRLPNVA